MWCNSKLQVNSIEIINGVTQIISDNPTLGQAMNSKEKEEWETAINIELNTLKELGTYEEVDITTIPNIKIIPTKFFLK